MPVGSYENGVSPYGAYDMAGNMWEWMADWYDSDYYSSSPSENLLGLGNNQNTGSKVLRGGSWSIYAGFGAHATKWPNELTLEGSVGRCQEPRPLTTPLAN